MPHPHQECNTELGRHVLLPVDGSANAHHAFNWFLKYGYRKNDLIIFAHVLEPQFAHSGMVIALDNPISIPREEVSLNFNEANEITSKFKQLAEKVGVNHKVVTLADTSVAEAILRLATEENANLIVVGTSGSGPPHLTVLGDVARHIITQSPVPVLVVPPARKTTPSA
ncbi:hypothetical protein Aperf_G00000027291 [Anoplocephala perfoliata]